jgi:hypothetical protein
VAAPLSGSVRDFDRSLWPILLLLTVAVVGFVVISSGSGRATGPALDPRSTEPSGARAAAQLIETLGRAVGVAEAHEVDDGVVIALDNGLDQDDWRELKKFASVGGTVVVGATTSPLWATDSTAVLRPELTLDEPCPEALAGLDDVRSLDLRIVRVFPKSDQGCLATADGQIVRIDLLGDGRVISLGGSALFRNDTIGQADHAVLVARLIGTSSGPVMFVERRAFAAGTENLIDLVPGWVFALLTQLGVAFVLYVVWRWIRLGQPVLETPVTAIEASELVTATGRLLANRSAAEWSSEVLHRQWTAEVRDRTGWASEDRAHLADLVAASAPPGVDGIAVAEKLANTFDTPIASSDEELVRQSSQVAAVRIELGWQSEVTV